MIVQIRGCNFVNKGAELMLYAVMQKMRFLYDDVILSLDLRASTAKQGKQVGLYQLAWMESKKVPWGGPFVDFIAGFLTRKLRDFFKIVRLRDVDVVLDASGFAYSDQRGVSRSELMAFHSRRMKQKGKKVILLPQAFGPFENHKIRDAVSEILQNSDLVFARDKLSYQYLVDLKAENANIQLAPDFTCIVEGKIPAYFDTNMKWACIVPNYRMIDSTSSDMREKYVPFLATCIEYITAHNIKPFVLIHETDRDHEIASILQSMTTQRLPIIQEPDPLYVKGILGASYVVVGSRYHALVGALSQGIPCLSTGWSHKYEALFEDYECPEYMIASLDGEDALPKLEKLIEEPEHTYVVNLLAKGKQKQQELTAGMWDEVVRCLECR
jgi:polysaccharide pyruvyl transferase WcaK-like protein